MKTPSVPDAAWVEQKIGRLLTPNGLMTVVALIFLSALVFSNSGIERRTMDVPQAEIGRTATSPLLGNP